MLGKRVIAAVALTVGFAAIAACGSGEADSQEAASGGASAAQTAETAMGEGDAMEQQGEMQLPEGVTQEMIAQGKEVYAGAGLCYVCHGPNGEGMAGLGADLTDDEWTHTDGSFEGLVETILNGVDASASSTGTAMPPKGGSAITEEQVRAVAAYVYSLSH